MSRREEIARLLMNTERETSELVKRLRANAGVHREIVPLLTRMGFANADCFNNAAKTDDEAATALDLKDAEIARTENHRNDLMDTIVSLRTSVAAANARAEKAEQERDEARRDVDAISANNQSYVEDAERARKERDEALKALGLILPLAKGYVHRNNVGSNAAYIEFADQVRLSAQKDQA